MTQDDVLDEELSYLCGTASGQGPCLGVTRKVVCGYHDQFVPGIQRRERHQQVYADSLERPGRWLNVLEKSGLPGRWCLSSLAVPSCLHKTSDVGGKTWPAVLLYSCERTGNTEVSSRWVVV